MSGLHDEQILGLTVYRPASELIARNIKPIENRRWPPYDWMIGRYIAIHASPHYEQSWSDFINRSPRFACDPPRREECPVGVVAVARLVGWVHRGPEDDQRPRTVKMLQGYAFGDNLNALGHSLDWRWFEGPYGWVLRDVVRIEPVACAGRQKLWKLPKFVYQSVRRRYDAARKNQLPTSGAGAGAGAAANSPAGSATLPKEAP